MSEDTHYTVHTNMVYLLIFTTIVLIITRIVVNLIDLPLFLDGSRDVDFQILLLGLKNGLVNFYDPVIVPEGVPDWPPYYLYFWYFIFYPMGLIPFEIGVYIWDVFRLVISSYIVLKGFKIIKSRTNLLWFYFTILVGFIIDGWYNNCNFLIIFFLLISYTSLEKDKMWLSGIFFALSTIKINSILFIPVLLLIRKIKLKDLVYYIIPFIALCLPYIIFPDYLFQMLNNWSNSTPGIQGLTPLDPIIWKALQPSHLMFLGFMFIIVFERLEHYEKGHQIRNIIVLVIILFYIYISITVWILPVIFIY
ncbi:MAG: glycosyltransferase family 87 protein [Candidatus Hermodarchaeota archaeon]